MTEKKPKTYNEEEFRKVLKSVSLKATPQRLAVHRAMMELGHASADMVADVIARHNDVKITVASIYNILTQLALLGIYQYRLSANNKMYFDINNLEHIHLYDTRNNTYKDIVDDELMTLIHEHLARKHFRGVKVDGIDIQILCHPSKSRKEPSEK